ncbi:MAG TPA: 2,3-bisphosphoglycerate-independent phosphoglycerate mutase [Chloroflexota bacterium]|nr:2,3-bisphosphoglycerate-independent phosphoglycerate mutase [Chloroflexota bacterium]
MSNAATHEGARSRTPGGGGVRPCVLIILDGWGIAPPGPGNAIALAQTPNLDRYWSAGPRSILDASGKAVGLPEGQIGNSEVGHLNLGAGFRVLQELPRIDEEIESGRFFKNAALLEAMAYARGAGKTLHLLGLFSHGGVHSHARHLYALLELAAQQDLRRVSVHAFLDGRDTPPRQAVHDLPELEGKLAAAGVGRIATVSGRYYAMDRDKRWDRTERAYRALVLGEGAHAPDALTAVQRAYEEGVGDEFVVPTVLDGAPGGDGPAPAIGDGDTVIWFNFRADRARQLSHALLLDDFDGFERPRRPEGLCFVTFTQYEADLPVSAVAFPPQHVEWPIARVISEAGWEQCHLAETEKYAHVTYFFNGGREEPFPGESRELIPSPKVATYDLQPEMSAAGVAEAAVERLRRGTDGFLVLNFANGDMVGHTGDLEAAIRAAETVDEAVGRVVAATLEARGTAALTADHGNAEVMVDPATGERQTAHTTNPVPFMLVGAPPGVRLKEHGQLADVAPTLLRLMGLSIPESMAGHGLLQDSGLRTED